MVVDAVQTPQERKYVDRSFVRFMKAMRSGDIGAARLILDAPGAMAGTGYHALAAAELGFHAGPSASTFEALRVAAGAADLDLRMVQESLRRAFDDLAAQGLEDAATELGPAFFAAAPSADLRMAERVVSRLASAGRWPTLLSLLDQAAGVLNPARIDRLRLQAQMGMGDLGAAGQTLDRLIAADPLNADLVQRKASLLARLDRPAEAFGVVRTAIEAGVAVDPVIAVDLGQRAGVPLDELIAFCQAHSPDHPAFSRLQAERFRMLLRLERPAEALAVAQQHLAFDPSSSWAWLGAAQILARMENEAEQADLAANLAKAERLPEAVRIKVLIHLRDYQVAEALLAKVPHNGQLDTELLTPIAAMRLRQGNYARLRPLIEHASRTSPALTAAAVTLASTRQLFGRDPSPEDFADLGSRLAPQRCPFEVRARHVLHLGGSLATGGAERQMALTASGSVDGWISEIALNSVEDHRNGLTELLQRAGVVCSSLKGTENSRRLRELMAQDPRHIDAVQRLGSLPPDIASEALLCYAAIVAHRPAVVHCWQDRMNIRGGLAAVAAGVPRIVLTGRHSYRELWRNRHPEMANLLTGLLRQSNVTFQCNSDFGAQSLIGWLDIDPTKVGIIRNQQRHVLRLEGQVRRHGRIRREAAEGARGGERPAQTAAGGVAARPGSIEGPSVAKVVAPAARRKAVSMLVDHHQMSERRACAMIGADRTSTRYRSWRPDDHELRERLRALASERRRFDYRRLHVLLRREGHVVNRKKTQRFYREDGGG